MRRRRKTVLMVAAAAGLGVCVCVGCELWQDAVLRLVDPSS